MIGIEDGIERWVSTIGRTTFKDERPNEFVGAALEITDRKRAEEALRDSEERFRRFAKFSSHVLWILDLDTMELDYLSPAFERVWGEAPASILANFQRWQNTIHSGDRDRVLAGVQRVRAGKSTIQDYRIVRPDAACAAYATRCFRSATVMCSASVASHRTSRRMVARRFTL